MSDQKSGRGRLQEVVVYNTTEANCEALTQILENLGVLDWRSLMGGGRTWRFDCS